MMIHVLLLFHISTLILNLLNGIFDHVGHDRMSRLAKEGLWDWLARVKLPRCELCLTGKATIKPFNKAMRASSLLELICPDICEPMNVKARHGATYFMTLTDDYSWYGYVYLLFHRYEALDLFRCLNAKVENLLEQRVKTPRTDRGYEYLLDIFKEFCEGKEIQPRLTIPCTLQQNGVVERRNQTVLDMVRLMMGHPNLPISFGGALLIVAYILNHVPSKSVSFTPYKLWHGRKSSWNYLSPRSSAGYVYNP